MSRFVDPFTDIGFKIVFGKENKSNDILMAFLNDLFSGEEDFDTITHLRYLNTERSRERLDDRNIIYDILCETQNGHRFIVEMQRQSQPFFFARSVYYMSRAIYEQGLKGINKENDDWNYNLIPVIGVFFCNFYVNELDRQLVQHIRLCDTSTHKPVGNLMRYAFIQLPTFRKSEEECTSEFDKWIYILKNMSTMQTMPFTSHRDIFERLASVSSVAALSPEERMQYDYDLKKARDYKAEMSFARKQGLEAGHKEGLKEGIQKGIQRGIQEGRRTERISIAKALKAQGLPPDLIEKATGISCSEQLSL